MRMCIESQLMHEDLQERIRNQVLQIPPDKRSIDLQDLVEWQPLTRKKKRAVARYFDEKVRFLSDRVKKLDARLADPLIYLHRYRNEAYHQAKVRQATIETAAKLLLDINCDLLLSLSRGWTSYASNEDYSWLEERFGKESATLLHYEGIVQSAVQGFRATIGLSDKDVKGLLVEHLASRIEDVFEALDFVVENSQCPDREAAIKDSYRFALTGRDAIGPNRCTLEEVESRHSTAFLVELRQKLSEIGDSSNRFEAFQRFAVLELQLEFVEDNVQELVAGIEHAIQMAIDIARGK